MQKRDVRSVAEIKETGAAWVSEDELEWLCDHAAPSAAHNGWIVLWNGLAYGPFAAERWARQWIESRGVEEPRYVVAQLLPPVSADGIKQAQKLAREAWKDVQP